MPFAGCRGGAPVAEEKHIGCMIYYQVAHHGNDFFVHPALIFYISVPDE